MIHWFLTNARWRHDNTNNFFFLVYSNIDIPNDVILTKFILENNLKKNFSSTIKKYCF